MSSLVQVAIHASQFPENVRRDLLESLRTRRVNHKFHYDSVKQTQKWLALHQAYSPSRTDADCAATYDRSFAAVAARIEARRVHLIGLGCGGGQKDTRLLKLLRDSGRETFYTPADVSTAMVLEARQTAHGGGCPRKTAFRWCAIWPRLLTCPRCSRRSPCPTAARLVTFFGMIPNFEPQVILPRLAGLLRPGGLSALQRQSCARHRLRRRRAAHPAALRQCPDARLADDVPAGSGRGGKRWRTPLCHRGRSSRQRPQARGGLFPV